MVPVAGKHGTAAVAMLRMTMDRIGCLSFVVALVRDFDRFVLFVPRGQVVRYATGSFSVR